MLLFQVVLLIAQLLLIAGILAFIFWRLARDISGHMDVELVVTPRPAFPVIERALQIKPGAVVYELGCGDGRVLFYLASRFPDARFVGVERNPLLMIYMRAWKLIADAPNVELRRENVFDTDFSDATHIYIFMLPPVLARLFADTPNMHGVRIASRAYELPGLTIEQRLELSATRGRWNEHMLYLYSL